MGEYLLPPNAFSRLTYEPPSLKLKPQQPHAGNQDMVLTKFESLAEELDYIVVRLAKEIQRSLGADFEPLKNQKRAEKLALMVFQLRETALTLGDEAEWL
jgi:hypothetical protein